jgi:hypothetical protein
MNPSLNVEKDLILKGWGIAAQILLLPLSKRLQRKARTKVDQRFFDYSPKKMTSNKFYIYHCLSPFTIIIYQ